MMLFPFIKTFQHSPIHCFEVCSSVLFNWCRDWFSFYPNPPIPILASIENVINHADPRLIRHLTAHDITAQDYAWPLMQTMFSEVFPKDDWQLLFDHIFFNHPGFFLYCVAAYVVIGKIDFSTKCHCHFSPRAAVVIVNQKRLSFFLPSPKSDPSSPSYCRGKTSCSKYPARIGSKTTGQKVWAP